MPVQNRSLACRLRLLVASAVGLLGAYFCFRMWEGRNDFTYHWLAARALLDGLDPYSLIKTGGEFHFASGYLYPLPAALVAIPFSGFSPLVASCLFSGLLASVIALGISEKWRLTALAGIPFVWAVSTGQMSLIITAGALIPPLSGLAIVKPNLALAVIAYRPKAFPWMVVGGVFLFLVSVLILPHWSESWLHSLKSRPPGVYSPPATWRFGFLVLLALFKWREPEARLLVAMALLPQAPFWYDQLPLMLVPRTKNQSMLLVISGFVGYVISSFQIPPQGTPEDVSANYAPAIILTLYLPCLVMVFTSKKRLED